MTKGLEQKMRSALLWLMALAAGGAVAAPAHAGSAGATLGGALVGEALGGVVGMGTAAATTPPCATEGCWPVRSFTVGIPVGAGLGGAVGAGALHGAVGGPRPARVWIAAGATGLIGGGLTLSGLYTETPALLIVGAPISLIGVPVVATVAGADTGGARPRHRTWTVSPTLRAGGGGLRLAGRF